MYNLLFIIFQNGYAEDLAIESMGEMVGGIIFLLLLACGIIWGISKLSGKGKK